MFIDSRTLPEQSTVQAGICIVGCGVAGIILALELEDRGIPVTILESGGFKEDPATQDLARGELSRRIYFALERSRLRYYGGCANHWAGLCVPLDDLDFSAREWVPLSGWPFGPDTLRPYYRRARDYLLLDSFPSPDRSSSVFGKGAEDEFEINYSQFTLSPRIASRYRKRIAASQLIRVFLWANVTRFHTGDDRRLAALTARTLPEHGGRTLRVHAEKFVLATGGIENARLLLSTAADHPVALGNQHGLVGRYFMEHVHALGGIFAAHNPHFPYRAHFGLKKTAQGNDTRGYFRLRDSLQREHALLNARVFLEKTTIEPDPLSAAIFHSSRILDDNPARPRFYSMNIICEQAPFHDSYVALLDQKDALGIPRVRLNWRVSDLDKKTIDFTLKRLAAFLARAGQGRMQIRVGNNSAWVWEFLTGGNHHMGTTRMARSPVHGVVDEHGRLFDVRNLLIAGSSVFPTGGHANPTYTIAALAVRMADRLARVPRPACVRSRKALV